MLVLITAAQGSLKLKESQLAMNTIRAYASPDAHIIYGAAFDNEMGDNVRVTVIATGLSRQNARRHVPPMQVISRTGTDDLTGFAPATATPPAGITIPVMTNVSPAGTVGASVWQTGRTAEPNPASVRVNQLSSSGLDDYEIPAFLRKQAD